MRPVIADMARKDPSKRLTLASTTGGYALAWSTEERVHIITLLMVPLVGGDKSDTSRVVSLLYPHPHEVHVISMAYILPPMACWFVWSVAPPSRMVDHGKNDLISINRFLVRDIFLHHSHGMGIQHSCDY